MTSNLNDKLEDLSALSHSLAIASEANDLESAKGLLERRRQALSELSGGKVAEGAKALLADAHQRGERGRLALASRRENLRQALTQLRRARQTREALKPPRSRRATSLDVAL